MHGTSEKDLAARIESVRFWMNFHFVFLAINALLALGLAVFAFLEFAETTRWPAYGYLAVLFLYLSGVFAVWWNRKLNEWFSLVPK